MVDEPAVVTGDNQRTFRLAQRFFQCFRRISTIAGGKSGGRGIRTPGAIADTTVFKTVTFGHSVSPPVGFRVHEKHSNSEPNKHLGPRNAS